MCNQYAMWLEMKRGARWNFVFWKKNSKKNTTIFEKKAKDFDKYFQKNGGRLLPGEPFQSHGEIICCFF